MGGYDKGQAGKERGKEDKTGLLAPFWNLLSVSYKCTNCFWYPSPRDRLKQVEFLNAMFASEGKSFAHTRHHSCARVRV